MSKHSVGDCTFSRAVDESIEKIKQLESRIANAAELLHAAQDSGLWKYIDEARAVLGGVEIEDAENDRAEADAEAEAVRDGTLR